MKNLKYSIPLIASLMLISCGGSSLDDDVVTPEPSETDVVTPEPSKTDVVTPEPSKTDTDVVTPEPSPANLVDKENESVKSLIDENLLLWNSTGIENYMFTYYAYPNDCPEADPFPPKVITVENAVVVSVYVPDFGTTIDVGNSPTISDIFISMADAAELNPMIFSGSSADDSSPPEFNQQYGFPASYFIDISGSECDGTTYNVSNFQ